MAVAVAITHRDLSNRKRQIATLTFSGTYSTGGEAPTQGFLKALELGVKVDFATIEGGGGVANGVVAQYDYTANKVKLFRTDQIDDFSEELPAATSLTNVGPLRGEFIGY